MKKILTVVIVTALVSAFFLFTTNEKVVLKSRNAPSENTPIDTKLPAQQTVGFSVEVHSAVLSEQGTAVTFSELSWNMYFKQGINAHSQVPAILKNISFISDNKQQAMPKELPFYVHYDGQAFSDVALLGLNNAHTLSVLPKVLNVLSYSLNRPLTFEDAQGVKTYLYSKNGHTVSRQIQSQPSGKNEKETWQLTLDKNKTALASIESLSYRHQQVWQQDNLKYDVVQSVEIHPIASMSFNSEHWTALHNKSIAVPDLLSQSTVDIDRNNFLSHLEALTQSLDPSLAKSVGEYLLQSHDINELKNLMTDNPALHSALIYALQKAQSLPAEQVLSDLLSDRELDKQIHQKIVMALGRFENASNIAFSSLEGLVDNDEDSVLSGMALLSIGTMNRFSPTQSQQVSLYLSEQLENPSRLPTTILAIANSQHPSLVNKLPNYLSHADTQVRKNTIQSLGHKIEYQDQVISSLIKSPNLVTWDTFSRVYQDANYPLSKVNLEKLQTFYLSESNPMIKKRLESILQIKG